LRAAKEFSFGDVVGVVSPAREGAATAARKARTISGHLTGAFLSVGLVGWNGSRLIVTKA
jgi:hypothetical protein